MNATTGLRASNVVRFVQQMFRIAEGIEVEDTEQVAELLHRDINGIENDRWAGPASLFTTPVAISPTTQSRSGIGGYLNEVVAAGYPLTISLHSLATRVLFKHGGRGKKPRATGVEYMVGEGLYSADRRYDPSQAAELRSVRAKKEVIVSGGAFNTPQILKLSGIGPREELEALEIPVLVDLPAVVSRPLPWQKSRCQEFMSSSDTTLSARDQTSWITTRHLFRSALPSHGSCLNPTLAREPSTTATHALYSG